jgi:SAM-dependent methyltransferase
LNNLGYDNYIKWKGWLDKNNSFFELNKEEESEFRKEFKACNVEFENIRVLEIGYGSGKLLRFLYNNKCSITGVEIQKELIEAAVEKEIKVYGSIHDTVGKYDLIVGFDVLEHLSIDQLKDLFYQAEKKLDINGKMLFRFPNADSYAGLAAQNGDYTHVTAIGKSKLEQIIEPYGFKIDSFRGANENNNNIIRKITHWFFRKLLIKLIGFNRPYFFSGNVIAVVKRNNIINKNFK